MSVLLAVMLLAGSTTVSAFFGCFSFGAGSRGGTGHGLDAGYRGYAMPYTMPAVYYPHHNPSTYTVPDVIPVDVPPRMQMTPGRLPDEKHPWERL